MKGDTTKAREGKRAKADALQNIATELRGLTYAVRQLSRDVELVRLLLVTRAGDHIACSTSYVVHYNGIAAGCDTWASTESLLVRLEVSPADRDVARTEGGTFRGADGPVRVERKVGGR